MKKIVSVFCLSTAIFFATALTLTANAQSVTHRIPMFENDQVKVWKTIIVPNSPLSMHRHEHGRTVVVLKGGTLTIQQDTGEKKTVEWKTGQAYWLDADPPGNKQHADVNETNDTIEVMVIENKKDN
jgi:quercetin dioxygenase-like cupin family protein